LQWDPVTESFPEDAEAMAMTRREQRKSFEIDVTV
jgi:hypothetical protein